MNEHKNSPVFLPALPISLLTFTVVLGFSVSGMLIASVLAGLLLSKEVIDVSGSPVPRWIGSSLNAMIIPLIIVFVYNISTMLFLD